MKQIKNKYGRLDEASLVNVDINDYNNARIRRNITNVQQGKIKNLEERLEMLEKLVIRNSNYPITQLYNFEIL